ncbi:hypothetical protein U7230_07360 [Carboxydochorda subterranea]|uniref:Uncharacterized protein n=1 Tax=Carboxydichorda subterranea TaxID=3109565 RepID=A0ABZ1C213_9FIRM|nr:hypothetical protein [Limnochorda sp. L945t]WRP18801.1 hypothetical protein U7230_07360 [Limnochorda sp. L945t]
MFSTREIATAIWLVVFLVLVLRKAEVRHEVAGVLRAGAHPKIVLPIVCLAAYTALAVWALRTVSLWNPALLKETVLWFVLTGLATASEAITSASPHRVIRTAVRDSLRVVVLFEFLVGSYTFPLFWELILVPLVVIVSMMDIVARRDRKSSEIAAFLHWIQVVVGLAIVGSALYQAAIDYATLVSPGTLRIIALGPILTLMFIPAIYVLLLCTNYEEAFIGLYVGEPKDRSLIRYAKRRMLIYANVSLDRVLELRRRGVQIRWINSREDVDELIRGLQRVRARNGQLGQPE